MDLVAEELSRELSVAADECVRPRVVRPRYRPRLTRLPGSRLLSGAGRKVDLAINRYLRYPRLAHRLARRFDAFHVSDHSYAHLLNSLPPGRRGCYCHDVDAFSALWAPPAGWRRVWAVRLARRLADALGRADVVFHSTQCVRAELVERGLVCEKRLRCAPLGPSREFCDRPAQPTARLVKALAPTAGQAFLLHVGSCIGRKGVDVLLSAAGQAIGRSAAEGEPLWLVKVGGVFSGEHDALIDRSGLRPWLIHVHDLSRAELAWLYQNTALVLQPSRAEGFGLPVLEAMACGARVLASELPVFHEVGREAIDYAPCGDVPAWVKKILTLRRAPDIERRRAASLAQAQRFSWAQHARVIAQAYRELPAVAGGSAA